MFIKNYSQEFNMISFLNSCRSQYSLYPERPHRQGGCLACCGCTFESRWGCTDFYNASGEGVLPIRVGGATSQLDLPSLTLLSVAGCGRLQLGVPHWAASVHPLIPQKINFYNKILPSTVSNTFLKSKNTDITKLPESIMYVVHKLHVIQ